MAIEKAGTLDGAKVREAVMSMEFKNTAMGNAKYRPDGTALHLLCAYQWWDGKLRWYIRSSRVDGRQKCLLRGINGNVSVIKKGIIGVCGRRPERDFTGILPLTDGNTPCTV